MKAQKIPIATGLASVTLDRGLYIVDRDRDHDRGDFGRPATREAFPMLCACTRVCVRSCNDRLSDADVVGRAESVGRCFRWRRSAALLAFLPLRIGSKKKRYLTVQSVENALFDFHHKTPGAFWRSFSLNLAAQCLAVSEVCLILWLMGVKMGFFSALVIEALTKLVNVLGNFQPRKHWNLRRWNHADRQNV